MAPRKTAATRKAAPAKKKGGPLRSKKPGRNQIAQPRKALRPRAPADAAHEAPAAEPAERPDPARPRAMLVAQAGLDKKAEDVLVLDVRGLTSYADYVVLMTADSDRQAGAIADAVDDRLKKEGALKVGVEGYESGRWTHDGLRPALLGKRAGVARRRRHRAARIGQEPRAGSPLLRRFPRRAR